MTFYFDTIESIVRSTLRANSLESISSDQIVQVVNDGYKDTAARAFCIERNETVATAAGERIIEPVTNCGVNKIVAPGGGLVKISPECVGWVPIDGNSPQYWFPWGKYVAIEPVPDGVYQLGIYYSGYPLTAVERGLVVFQDTADVAWEDTSVTWQRSLLNDYLSELPHEFHSCVIDFSLYALSMKFRNWKEVSAYYNNYIRNLNQKREEYLMRKVEERSYHYMPDSINTGGL